MVMSCFPAFNLQHLSFMPIFLRGTSVSITEFCIEIRVSEIQAAKEAFKLLCQHVALFPELLQIFA